MNAPPRKQAIFTSYEGDYHLGVGALLNSAVRAGFKGEYHIFYRDRLPPWVSELSSEGNGRYRCEYVTVVFRQANRARHFGYDKPFQALELIEADDQLEAIFYFDPDIVILAPWSFFESWVIAGVGLVLDGNFPVVPANHPWRSGWRKLAGPATPSADVPVREPLYANSGFFGLQTSDRSFLEMWRDVTFAFEEQGGDTMNFHLDRRWLAVTGDQDLLAATLDQWDGDVSMIGPDGMGFNGHYWLLSHATERPKPWDRTCVRSALRGDPPPRTVQWYLDHANGPVTTLPASGLSRRHWSYLMGRAIGRFYRRTSP